jgi:tripartite-type tricarboxylate transporter receptor subunit TctC
MPKRIVLTFLVSALTLSPSMTGVAGRLDAAEPFYQGKTLRVVVASAGGGGSDIVARLMMRHLPRHIPGNPTLVVENMPGAGEIIGTNYVYGKAKPDGLTALFATGTPINQLIELPGIEFDVTKMPIIGGSSESVAAFVRTDKTGVKSARDLLKPKAPIVIGGSGYGSIKDVSMLAAMNLLGVRKSDLRHRLRRRRPDPSRLRACRSEFHARDRRRHFALGASVGA